MATEATVSCRSGFLEAGFPGKLCSSSQKEAEQDQQLAQQMVLDQAFLMQAVLLLFPGLASSVESHEHFVALSLIQARVLQMEVALLLDPGLAGLCGCNHREMSMPLPHALVFLTELALLFLCPDWASETHCSEH